MFGAVACSDDSSSSAPVNDDKKEGGLQVFDAKGDLPSCDKFDGVVAQVIHEKAFFACVDDSWEQVDFSAPSYEQLPKCDASMNDFCVDITEGEKIEDSYICDEGEWVKGSRIKGFDGCFKGNENRAKELCLTPVGIRSYCYVDEKGDDHCVEEEYGGKRGHIENGVCVED